METPNATQTQADQGTPGINAKVASLAVTRRGLYSDVNENASFAEQFGEVILYADEAQRRG